MRVSRAPEYRNGSGSPIILILVLLAVLIVGGIVIYLLLGRSVGSSSEELPPPTVAPQPLPTLPPQPRQDPPPAIAPPGGGVLDVVPENTAGTCPKPEVLFGEVLSEGYVDLELLTGGVRTYYAFQVDTSTQNIVLFFGMYDPACQAVSRSIVVEDYSQAELITNAEVTVYYPDAPPTVIRFDKDPGTVVSSQFYTTQPYDPGLFSPQMRIALIRQNLLLQNADSSIVADLQLDPTGVSTLSGYRVTRNDPATTETALTEIQAIIDQLESRRPRS